MKVYMFPGLGADARQFQAIELPRGYELKCLDYIHPGRCRTLQEYGDSLISHYSFEPHSIVGGVSLGAILAQKIASSINAQSLLLVSTLVQRAEMPLALKAASVLNLGCIAYKPFLQALGAIGDKFTLKSKEGRRLFYDMLNQADPDVLRFGTNQVLKWHAFPHTIPMIRIHGDQDRVFPISNIGSCHIIRGGNHFMIFEKAAEINRLLEIELATPK